MTFLQDDMETAARKYHLTARQAGTLARQAHVRRMVSFHFSPKYKIAPHVLVEDIITGFIPYQNQRGKLIPASPVL